MIPVIVAIIGLLIYLALDRGNGAWSDAGQEVGRIMFFCGLLATLLGPLVK